MKSVGIALFVVLCLVGCKKQDENHLDAPASQNSPTVPSADEPKPAAFNPLNSEPVRASELQGDLASAYGAAAAISSPYIHSLAYEQQGILTRAIPSIEQMLKLNADNLRRSPKSQSASTLMKLDARFAGVALRQEIKKLIAENSPAPQPPVSPLQFQIDDPGGIEQRETPSVSGAPAQATRVSPEAVVRGVNEYGNMMAAGFRNNNLDLVLQKETERLLQMALSKGANYEELFQLAKADSLETRAAKIALKSGFQDFLGQIVAYKGSFFLGMECNDGRVLIWEFKQPISISASRSEPDERTRLNMGVEMTATIAFGTENSADSLQRCYSGGWWTSWTTFPDIAPIKITKTGRWTVDRSYTFHDRRCFRLSVPEIEMALSNSDTTKLVAQAEAQVKDPWPQNYPADSLLTLLECAAAHGDIKSANTWGDDLTHKENLPVSIARPAAGILSDVFYQRSPKMAGDFYKSVLFDTGGRRGSGRTPQNRDMWTYMDQPKTKPAPPPPFPDAEISQLAAAYAVVTQAETNNADAHFDLALICALRGYRGLNTQVLERCAEALQAAIRLSEQKTPESKRDFRTLAANYPTFLPLFRCDSQYAEGVLTTVVDRTRFVLTMRDVFDTYGY